MKINEDNGLENHILDLITNNKNIAISFVDSSYNKDSRACVEYFSNGKRIFENYVYEDKTSRGRMIVSSVSINMGRLGFKYIDRSMEDFYLELDEWLDLAKGCLTTIFEIIGDKNKENYKPIYSK